MKPLATTEEESTRTLASGIATRLRTEIANGEIAPGEKLHLDELRARFGVSLSPLREALSRLSAEGFVVVMENQRGFRVAPVSENNLLEVTRLRAEIEAFALREAIARGDDRWEGEVVAALHRLSKLERALPAGPRVEEWENAHRAFHESLLAACRMPLLLNFCTTLHDLSDRYRRLFLEDHPIDRDVMQEHRNICDATLERRADEACALLREHIERTGRLVLGALGEKDPQLMSARASASSAIPPASRPARLRNP
ncbi:MAG TPA: FCD domain-containing protein [Burkholderiales bacterium]|nr:FCD domain-containing protein [Burkholderiales bacterium]